MKLYCVRHGEASPDEAGVKRLTKNGQGMVLAAAHQMHEKCSQVSSILHSGVPRTEETAQILATELCVDNVEAAPALLAEHAPAKPLIDMIQAWEDDTMLVGHLPMLMQFMTDLLQLERTHHQIVQFMPATVVCLERMDNGQWLIDWVLAPEIL